MRSRSHAGGIHGQAVAEVHHGGGFGVCHEPLCLCEAGREAQMAAAAERAAEGAGDGDEVAGACAVAKAEVLAAGEAEHSNRDCNDISTNGIATDDLEAEGARSALHATQDSIDAGWRGAGRDAK